MSDDVQTLQRSQNDSESDVAAMENENVAGSEAVEETNQRKRRRFRPDEIRLANKFVSLAEPGTPIEFSELETELKRAVLPNRQTRLVDRGILEVDYDEETGLLKTVTVNQEMLKEYEWDLIPPKEVRASATVTKKGEPRQRKPRNLLADPKYKISLAVDKNPKRPGSHSFLNWEHCYHDSQSIPDYLSQMDYPRSLVTSKGTYFNGPSTLYIEQDLKAGHIGIYDSTLPVMILDETTNEMVNNQAIWVKFEDLNRFVADDPEPDEDDETESEETTDSPTV
jgi:hypothetical protein